MSLFKPKSLTRQPCNPYLPSSTQGHGTGGSGYKQVSVSSSSIPSDNPVQLTPLLPTWARWSSSQTLDESWRPIRKSSRGSRTKHHHPLNSPSLWTNQTRLYPPPLSFPSHVLNGYGEGSCFLTPATLISGFSKFKSAAPKTFLIGHKLNQITSF